MSHHQAVTSGMYNMSHVTKDTLHVICQVCYMYHIQCTNDTQEHAHTDCVYQRGDLK